MGAENRKLIKDWTKQEIIDAIREINAQKEPLNNRYVSKAHGRVYRAAHKGVFGSWKKAVQAAGFDYREICVFKNWSKKEVIQQIKKIAARGEPLNYAYVYKNYRPLYSCACRPQRFGAWAKAVTKAGFNYRSICEKRLWNKNKVIQKIKEIAERGEPLNPAYIWKKHTNFYAIVTGRRYFKTWQEALAAAGLDHKDIYIHRSRTKQEILEEIGAFYDKHGSLRSTLVQKEASHLYAIATRKYNFKTWKNAVEKAGFNYYKVTNVNRWDKNKILFLIKALSKRNIPLTENSVKKNHNDLYIRALRKQNYGSWDKALTAAGIDFERIRQEEELEKMPFVDASLLKSCSRDMPINNYIIEFLGYSRFVKKKVQRTIQAYKGELNKLNEYLKRRRVQYMDQINFEILSSYFALLRRKGKTLVTIDTAYYTIRLFLDYCMIQEYIKDNPINKIGRPKMGKKMSVFLTQRECLRLVKYAVSNYTLNQFTKTRNLLILCLVLFAGLKPVQMAKLKLKDVSLKKKLIILKKNANSRPQTIPICIPLLQVIKRYLYFRSKSASANLLISSFDASALGFSGIYENLRSLLRGVNLYKRISLRDLRVTFASLLLNSGVSLIYLQKILGHENYSHTLKYIAYATDKIRNTIEKVGG